MKVYRELKGRGDVENRAYDAAVRVFQHFHPKSTKIEAYETVGNWLDEHEVSLAPDGQLH